ncbi:basic proline-rich protein-like [Meriones unguiculatus]|uniref:basic proline-rich protein-like n=1 Tax=Meriones unguiculatus TaxID=10047 RepID=UPI000B4F3357|nr:basic proline-rich protein-like [Meriones unguiculatus]
MAPAASCVMRPVKLPDEQPLGDSDRANPNHSPTNCEQDEWGKRALSKHPDPSLTRRKGKNSFSELGRRWRRRPLARGSGPGSADLTLDSHPRRASGIFQAGCRCLRGKVRAGHVTRRGFQVCTVQGCRRPAKRCPAPQSPEAPRHTRRPATPGSPLGSRVHPALALPPVPGSGPPRRRGAAPATVRCPEKGAPAPLPPPGARSRGPAPRSRRREDARGGPARAGEGPPSPPPPSAPRGRPRASPPHRGRPPSACAQRRRACRPHSPHPLRELVTSCPRPISVRGQSVAPCRRRETSPLPRPLRPLATALARAGRGRGGRERTAAAAGKFPDASAPPRGPRWGTRAPPRPSPKPGGPLQVERRRGEPGAARPLPRRGAPRSRPLRRQLLRPLRPAVPPVNRLRPPPAARRPPPARRPGARRAAAARGRGEPWRFRVRAAAAGGLFEGARRAAARGAPREAPAGAAPGRGPPRPRRAPGRRRRPPRELRKLGAPGGAEPGRPGESPPHAGGCAGRRSAARGAPRPPLRPARRGEARPRPPALPAGPRPCAALRSLRAGRRVSG